MIIQKIKGGLGNQMFQYAYIKALSLRKKQEFMIDIFPFITYKIWDYGLEIFNIEKTYARYSDIPFYERLYSANRFFNFIFIKIKSICKKLNKNHYAETNFKFDAMFCNIENGYIEGYFQSAKYFKDFEIDIRKDFIFNLPLSEKSQKIKDKIQDTNSIGIHIRRGDYLQGNNLEYHGICGIDYYTNAIKYINSHIKNPTFFFFSDDIERVKNNFKYKNTYFVDRNIGKDSWQDMQLMSLCKHNIIANSSFSWRSAWLNNNTNKIVIAPKRWFTNNTMNMQTKDLILSSWIRI